MTESCNSTTLSGRSVVPWLKLEELIVDAVRKNNSIAAEARVSEQETSRRF